MKVGRIGGLAGLVRGGVLGSDPPPLNTGYKIIILPDADNIHYRVVHDCTAIGYPAGRLRPCNNFRDLTFLDN